MCFKINLLDHKILDWVTILIPLCIELSINNTMWGISIWVLHMMLCTFDITINTICVIIGHISIIFIYGIMYIHTHTDVCIYIIYFIIVDVINKVIKSEFAFCYRNLYSLYNPIDEVIYFLNEVVQMWTYKNKTSKIVIIDTRVGIFFVFDELTIPAWVRVYLSESTYLNS